MTRASLLRTLLAASTLAAAQGCGAHGPPELVGEEDSYLFDTVQGGPGMHTFRWTNTGGAATGPLAVTLTGDVDSFKLTADACHGLKLGGGESCSVTVQLANDVEGLYAAQLHVQDPSEKSIASCLLSGKVAPAALQAVADAKTSVVQGNTGVAKVVVTNVGGARTSTLTSSITSGFTAVTDGCNGTTLSGGQSCTVQVGYQSSLDDSGVHKAHVAVSGLGLAADADVAFVITSAGKLVLSNTDFGNIDPAVGGDLAVTVRNQSTVQTQPLVTELQTDAMSPVSYYVSYDQCKGATLAAGDSCAIHLNVYPVGSWNEGTSYNATLSVSADNVHSSVSTVTLSAIDNHAAVFLTLSGSGTGQISTNSSASPYLACSPAYCPPVVYVLAGAPRAVFASANPGSNFVAWTGICSGSNRTCTFTPQKNVDIHLDAQFSH